MNSEIIPEETLSEEAADDIHNVEQILKDFSLYGPLPTLMEFKTINDTGVSLNLFATLENVK